MHGGGALPSFSLLGKSENRVYAVGSAKYRDWILRCRKIALDLASAIWYNARTFLEGEENMSQHPSLRGSSKITSKRNVLKRFERVNLLQKRGEWKEGSCGLGLKKTKPEA